MAITHGYRDFIDKETKAQSDQRIFLASRQRRRNRIQQCSHVYVHRDEMLKPSGDELTGTGSSGSERDLGRR